MAVLVSPTTKSKPFPVPANSLGLETDAKLRKVINESALYSMYTGMSSPHNYDITFVLHVLSLQKYAN